METIRKLVGRCLAHVEARPVYLALVWALAVGCGADTAPPPTGQVLYLEHCSSCHGESGKGDGPVAASLKIPPADLTAIAKRAGGKFDQTAVLRIIDGRRIVDAHGPRDMPVWGAVFAAELEGQRHAGRTVLLHAGALTDYLRSIQEDSPSSRTGIPKATSKRGGQE